MERTGYLRCMRSGGGRCSAVDSKINEYEKKENKIDAVDLYD